MGSEVKLYGLSVSERRILFDILRSHTASLNSVKLFGSRARGDYRKTSDIDLAISGQSFMRSRLAEDFSDSLLPHTVDIVDYDGKIDVDLRKNIDKDGKVIFLTQGGVALMTAEQVKDKLANYVAALEKLRIAVEKDASDDDMYVDATVQRFEFCFELAWKLMKSYLEYEGISVNSPRSSIREGFKANLLDDAAAWLDMLEQRNLASHTYDEAMAAKLYRNIKDEFFSLLVMFKNEMEQKIIANA